MFLLLILMLMVLIALIFTDVNKLDIKYFPNHQEKKKMYILFLSALSFYSLMYYLSPSQTLAAFSGIAFELYIVIFFFVSMNAIIMGFNLVLVVRKAEKQKKLDSISKVIALYEMKNNENYQNLISIFFSLVFIASIGITKINGVDSNTFNNIIFILGSTFIGLIVISIMKNSENSKQLSRLKKKKEFYDMQVEELDIQYGKISDLLDKGDETNSHIFRDQLESKQNEIDELKSEVLKSLDEIMKSIY